MQIGVAKAGRSVPEKKSLSASELSSLVAAWRQKRPLPQRVTWSSLLADFEKTDSEQGWLLSLASSPERQQALLNFLNQAEEEEKKTASDAIRNAILDEILEFSLGLAANPTVARFSFSMDGTKLEALAKLIGSDSVSDEIEEALLAFDRQVEERESRLQARLAWKPSAPQRRVSQNVSSAVMILLKMS